ncbi:MAG: hypothetical protein AB1405_08050, partial [Bdellovibrionota bacterium]
MKTTRGSKGFLAGLLVAALAVAGVALAVDTSDQLDITSFSSPTVNSPSFAEGCQSSEPSAPFYQNCDPSADPDHSITVSGNSEKQITIAGQVHNSAYLLSDTDCSNPPIPSISQNPCLNVKVVNCYGAGTCAALPAPAGNPVQRTIVSPGGGAGARTFSATVDLTPIITSGSPSLVIEMSISSTNDVVYPNAVVEREYVVVNYVDPASATPVACLTNAPRVNELGRITTNTASLTLEGRVTSNVTGAQVSNPLYTDSDWSVSGACGGPASYDPQIDSFSVVENGSPVPVVLPDFEGINGSCADTEPLPLLPTHCTNYLSGAFSIPYNINTNTQTILRVQPTNSFGTSSADIAIQAGGLNDDFTIIHDGGIPSLDNGNFTLLKSDFDTRVALVDGTPLTFSNVGSRATLMGRAGDSSPGRLAYVGYDLSSTPIEASVNPATGEVTISSTSYSAMTAKAPIKAGDVVFFDGADGGSNAGRSFRLQSIAAGGPSDYRIQLFGDLPTAGILGSQAQVTTIGVASVLNSTGYTATINGTGCTYTSDATATRAEILSNLTTVINSGACSALPVTAYNRGDVIELRHDTPPTGFSVTANANLRVRANSFAGKTLQGYQNATVTVGAVQNSAVYTVTVDGTARTYNSDATATQGEILRGLRSVVDADPNVEAELVGNQLKIVSENPPNGFRLTSTANLSIANVASAAIRVRQVSNSTAYNVYLDGTLFTTTSDATATEDEILTALRTAIDASPSYAAIYSNGFLKVTHQTGPDFEVGAGPNLVVGEAVKLTVRHTAAFPFRPQVAAGGTLTFNYDTGNADTRAFDNMIARGAVGTGDWVVFASTDPSANANRRFQITSINTGVDPRTITISATSTGGQALVVEASGASRLFVIRNSTGIVDGEDTQAGYDCNEFSGYACTNASWATDTAFEFGVNPLTIRAYDDAGNSRTYGSVEVNFSDATSSVVPPIVKTSQLFFYNTMTDALNDTAPNTNPTLTACVSPCVRNFNLTVASPPPVASRLLGNATGVKFVGTVATDLAGPAYPVGGNTTPDIAHLEWGGVDLTTRNISMVATSALSESYCGDRVAGAGNDPVGYCFVWFLNLHDPTGAYFVTGAATAGASPTTTITIPGVDLTRVGLGTSDKIWTDRFGLQSISGVAFAAGNTSVTIPATAYNGS